MTDTRFVQRICCICLSVGTEYYCFGHEFKNLLKSICPLLESELPVNSRICSMCLNTLIVLNRFKRQCNEHERKIRNKVAEVGRKINLSQLDFPAYFMNGIDIYVCRLCSKAITNNQYANLNTQVDGMCMRDLHLASLPEVIMDYTYSPIFCEHCTNFLRSLYRFIKMCTKTKYRIINYIAVRNINMDKVNRNELLFAVRQYFIDMEGPTHLYIYVCGICGLKAREDVDMWNHMVLVHHVSPETLRRIGKIRLQCSICHMFVTENKTTLERHVAQHNPPTAAGSTSNVDGEQATNRNHYKYVLVDFMGNPIQPSLAPVSNAGKSNATLSSGNIVILNRRPSNTSNLELSNFTTRPNLHVSSTQSNSTITSNSIGQSSSTINIVKPETSNTNISITTQQNLHTNDTGTTSSNNIPITPISNLPRQQALNVASQASCSCTNSGIIQNDATGNQNSILKALLSTPVSYKSTCSSAAQSNHSDQIAGSSKMSAPNSGPKSVVKTNQRVVVKRLIYRGNPSKVCFSNPNFVDSNPVPEQQAKKTRPNILKRARCPKPYTSSNLRTVSSPKPVTQNAASSQDNTDGNATNNTEAPKSPSLGPDTTPTSKS